jgi:hypothetical protein
MPALAKINVQDAREALQIVSLDLKSAQTVLAYLERAINAQPVTLDGPPLVLTGDLETADSTVREQLRSIVQKVMSLCQKKSALIKALCLAESDDQDFQSFEDGENFDFKL